MCYCYVNKYGGGNRLLNQSKSYFSSGFRSGCATRNLKKNGGWVRQISRSARQSKRKYSDNFCPVKDKWWNRSMKDNRAESLYSAKVTFCTLRVWGTGRGSESSMMSGLVYHSVHHGPFVWQSCGSWRQLSAAVYFAFWISDGIGWCGLSPLLWNSRGYP